MFLDDADARDLGNDIRKLIDRDHAVLTEVQWLGIVRSHEFVDALDAVVDVAKRARLLAVAPDLDFVIAGEFRDCDLAAHRRRGLFTAAFPGSFRAEYVVKTHGPSFHAVILAVMRAQSLGDEFFPTVCILGLGGIGVVFL